MDRETCFEMLATINEIGVTGVQLKSYPLLRTLLAWIRTKEFTEHLYIFF